MQNYFGTECPFCNEIFKEGDDVVVCPECGTPHHRECWKQHGECANVSMHGSDYTWSASVQRVAESSDSENTNPESASDTDVPRLFCRRCGHKINSDSVFCSYCGTPVFGAFPTEDEQSNPVFQAVSTEPDFDDNEEIDGITIKEWKTYIGQNYGYYIYSFKHQDETGKKTSFTIGALLFPFIYFLYRKVWGVAAIAAIINWVSSIPNILYMLNAYLGIDFGISINVLNTLSTISQIAVWGINVLWALFAVTLYRRASAKRIYKFREQFKDDENGYFERLNKASGPSKTAVIILLAVVAVLSIAVSFMSAFTTII